MIISTDCGLSSNSPPTRSRSMVRPVREGRGSWCRRPRPRRCLDGAPDQGCPRIGRYTSRVKVTLGRRRWNRRRLGTSSHPTHQRGGSEPTTRSRSYLFNGRISRFARVVVPYRPGPRRCLDGAPDFWCPRSDDQEGEGARTATEDDTRLGDHQHARVENAFVRYTSIVGDCLRARSSSGQRREAVLACNVLNRMTELGRPVSYRIGK